MDNAWSEMTTSTFALTFIAFLLIGLYNEYGTSQFSCYDKPYGFIQTLFNLKPLINNIL